MTPQPNFRINHIQNSHFVYEVWQSCMFSV